MQITRYKKHGHYDFHFDGNGFTRFNMPQDQLLHGTVRKLSMTIVLNEDYEGGGTYFPKHKLLLKAKQGVVAIHPGMMTHQHGVRPIIKGERYAMVSFCKFIY